MKGWDGGGRGGGGGGKKQRVGRQGAKEWGESNRWLYRGYVCVTWGGGELRGECMEDMPSVCVRERHRGGGGGGETI